MVAKSQTNHKQSLYVKNVITVAYYMCKVFSIRKTWSMFNYKVLKFNAGKTREYTSYWDQILTWVIGFDWIYISNYISYTVLFHDAYIIAFHLDPFSS